ncbi:L-gulonolactone oxidase 2-like [Nymphaea colorata]|nr:L-gulonolactone oxidase 2-like [Nymphaea colorata]
MMAAFVIKLLVVAFAFHTSTGSPPGPVVTCSTAASGGECTVTNAYATFPDRSVCSGLEVAYPASEQELLALVARATLKRQKMKVATRYSHSIPKLVCPGGTSGLIISTNNLNHTIGVDSSAMTITVESGATLKDIIGEAARAGLALPYAPYWLGLTIGGLLGTGAHGSSLWGNGSAVHDYVVGMRMVTPASAENGYAAVRSLMAGDPEMDAAKVSLGVLGVISQVTLKLEPMFKRSVTMVVRDDSDLDGTAVAFGGQHEFGDITWYPGQKKAVYRVDDRTSVHASGDGRMDFIPFRSTPTIAVGLTRIAEEALEVTQNSDGKCVSSKLLTSTLLAGAYGLTNDGLLFTGYPVVGFHNRLQASGSCLDSPNDGLLSACAWDPRIHGEFFHQTTFSIGVSKVGEFISDVKKLRDLAPESLCGVELYNGILMRYVKASSAYLGKQEDGIDFDITYYRAKDPLTPRLHEDVLEEIEQMALFKYGALPHWGKNRNIAFDGVMKKYANAKEFLKVKDAYDPLGLFSSEWTYQVLGIQGNVTIVREGCALEGLCICSEDVHCAPNKGYFCRPGKVYTDARVCRKLS